MLRNAKLQTRKRSKNRADLEKLINDVKVWKKKKKKKKEEEEEEEEKEN